MFFQTEKFSPQNKGGLLNFLRKQI